MIWIQFAATALVIVLAGVRLARYGDVLGEKSGLLQRNPLRVVDGFESVDQGGQVETPPNR